MIFSWSDIRYATLRNQGVEIGKAEYVPHMFAYLRPGTIAAA